MAELVEDIEGLVDCVVRPLVENADDLKLSSTVAEDGSIYVEIECNEEDTGKVIGRQGRAIKAIRTIARAAASRAGVQVDVELSE